MRVDHRGVGSTAKPQPSPEGNNSEKARENKTKTKTQESWFHGEAATKLNLSKDVCVWQLGMYSERYRYPYWTDLHREYLCNCQELAVWEVCW